MVAMYKIHAYFVFHLGQRCMLFYGQLEQRDVAEATFTKVFVEAEKLLIGQSKIVTIDDVQFVLLNHEDIISGALVSDVSWQEEKEAVALLTKIGKAFKRKFQAEIDEYDPNACDLATTFGGFSSTLAAMLAESLVLEGTKAGGKNQSGESGHGTMNVASTGEGRQQPASIKFPGGEIPPEERDEVLFHEYEELSTVYNVEMIDGVVSRNKIYIYTNVGEYHEIIVDYTAFPALPRIELPASLSDILAIARTVQGWNPENPPRVVDVIAEIEQLVGIMHPAGPTPLERAAEIDGYMNELGFEGTSDKSGKELSRVEKKTASNVLASRLLAKEKKETSEGTEALGSFVPGPLPVFVDQIIDEKQQPEHKTSLRDMVARQKTGEGKPDSTSEESLVETKPGPGIAVTDQEPPAAPAPSRGSLPATSQKPQKFVIRPRFIVDGDEILPGRIEPEPEQAPPASQQEPKPAPSHGSIDDSITIAPRPAQPSRASRPEPAPATSSGPGPQLIAKPAASPNRDIDEIDHGIDIVSRPRPAAPPKNFAIPDVNDLDSFVPAAPAARPAIQTAPAQASKSQVAPATRPATKVAPAPALKATPVPTTTTVAKQKTAPRKKDDEDMFGWGDDGAEMEIKQSKVEIKDFDGPIMKVKDGK